MEDIACPNELHDGVVLVDVFRKDINTGENNRRQDHPENTLCIFRESSERSTRGGQFELLPYKFAENECRKNTIMKSMTRNDDDAYGCQRCIFYMPFSS